MPKFTKVLLIVLLLIYSETTAWAACSGNACNEVRLTRENGCLHVTNSGDRRVKFSMGVGHAPEIYPGEKVKLLTLSGVWDGTGQCMKSINSWKANYL